MSVSNTKPTAPSGQLPPYATKTIVDENGNIEVKNLSYEDVHIQSGQDADWEEVRRCLNNARHTNFQNMGYDALPALDRLRNAPVDLSHPDINRLAQERDELMRWKKEMLKVLDDLNLQEIGNAMGLTIGDYVADKILPHIRNAARGDGWKPIDTAPRDGAWILAYWPTMSITEYPTVVFADDCSEHDIWHKPSDLDYGCVYPTHWMHLPPVPLADTTLDKLTAENERLGLYDEKDKQ